LDCQLFSRVYDKSFVAVHLDLETEDFAVLHNLRSLENVKNHHRPRAKRGEKICPHQGNWAPILVFGQQNWNLIATIIENRREDDRNDRRGVNCISGFSTTYCVLVGIFRLWSRLRALWSHLQSIRPCAVQTSDVLYILLSTCTHQAQTNKGWVRDGRSCYSCLLFLVTEVTSAYFGN
jgi:hypothetical protein